MGRFSRPAGAASALRTSARPRACHVAVLLFIATGSLLAVEPDPASSPLPPMVLAAREFRTLTAPGARLNTIERASRGALLLLEADGTAKELVQAATASTPLPVDVSDPAISYDGEHVVFAGFVESEGAWRIFEVGADGNGLRQLTRSDRRLDLSRYGEAGDHFATYDDTDPCYLPDGRVCFVSTRYPGVAPAGRVRTTNLYVMGADGDNVHRITTERFGGDTPAVDPETGNIVYSRWWLTVPSELPTPGARRGPAAGSRRSAILRW